MPAQPDPLDDLLPQALPDLTWRTLESADLPAIKTLTAACAAQDGGLLTTASDEFISELFLPPHPGTAAGAWLDDELIACAAVWRLELEDDIQITLTGQVHPAHRRKGLGGLLLHWSLEQAEAFLSAAPPEKTRTITIRSEAVNSSAVPLYTRHGFQQSFAEDVLRHRLQDPIPEAPFPDDVTVRPWETSTRNLFFDVYEAAFRDRPGFPGWSRDTWIGWTDYDDDFRPALSLLASAGEIPVGFITCGKGYIIQIGVRPEWRGRGLGKALLSAALKGYQELAEGDVLLDVNANNPSAAALFGKLGFERIGRRGEFRLIPDPAHPA